VHYAPACFAMLTTDRFSGTILLLFALWVMWQSRILPLGNIHQPGAGLIPVLLASVLLICGAMLVLSSSRAPLLASIGWPEWRHAVAILIAATFAALALERLGYRLTMLLVLAFLLKAVEKRGWVVSVTYALGLAFGSFFLFQTILRVPLTLGPLGF
jgi:putative tricarboxylic transport membrane protein